jgi:uncharacterized protein (DUF885 family)
MEVVMRPLRFVPVLLLCVAGADHALAQAASGARRAEPIARDAPGRAVADSELRDLVDRYSLDRAALLRRYPVESSPERIARVERFLADWQKRAEAVAFEPLAVEGRIDLLLLRSQLAYEAKLLKRQRGVLEQSAQLLPFRNRIHALNDARLRMESVDPKKAAAELEAIAAEVEALRKQKAQAAGDGAAPRSAQLAAFRAQEGLAELKQTLAAWHGFSAGYDPVFTWWVAAPYKRLLAALDAYRAALREKLLGIRPDQDEPIVGTPIGRDALVSDLASEWVAYTPEELLKIADREFAWCESEMRQAARALGNADDWKAALEKVKTLHVEPGKQPQLIRELALEAEEYLERHELVTLPPLAKEVWRMQMMSAERQKVNPFFTGGEVISVSFPTDAMEHSDKLMSLRGNNIHFARATVFHELIPGHHLQQFMNARYNPHRRAFETPFWREGWALYWEMLLWDRGFTKTPENRIGALFWRMHRAARIMFSLRFHLGEWTPQQCIDFLVDKVGHERRNAEAEVRRSFNGTYPPLYQLAYMIGGLQFRALYKELVETRKLTDRQFHDAVLTGGPMPVEMVRARLTKQLLPRDHKAVWK